MIPRFRSPDRSPESSLTRRGFIATAAAGVTAAMGVPATGVMTARAATARAADPAVEPAGSGVRRIRIAQIGTAHSHAAGKMRAVRALPELFEVVGIAEPDPVLGREARRAPDSAYAGLEWLTPEAILGDPSVEVVVVETALREAAATAMASVRAGKHVHLDKPGAADHRAFREMRREAERTGRTVQMGYMLRYNPAFELLFRAHREGWFGSLTEIDASMGKRADTGFFAELAGYPGNGMFELGCHLVDAVVHLAGEPGSVHAFGRSGGRAPAGVAENQMAVLEYPGTLVTLRCNHDDPFGGAHRRFQVVGTRGAMEIQPLESGRGVLRLAEAREGFVRGDNPLELSVSRGRYEGEFRDLARVIRGGQALAWSADHDIAVHATALRCAGVRVEG